MRSLAEWLVVPLLLLPVAAGAGLVLWAQDAHRRAQAPYQGAGAAEAWLREDGAAGWMPDRVADLETRLPADLVCCRHPTASAYLRVPCEAMGTGGWVFSADLASPLTPAMLVEPGVRLALETGSAPVDIDGVAEGAAALRALLAAPDLGALRNAPLPPLTKRYVLGRWRRAGLQSVAIEEDYKAWHDVMVRLKHMFQLQLDLSDLDELSQALIADWHDKIEQISRAMPQLDVGAYMEEVYNEFTERSFVALSDVWEDELRDLLDDF